MFLSFCRCCHRLQLIDYLRHLLNRHGKVSYILDKCLDLANCDHACDTEETAGNRYGCVSKVTDQLHQRHHHTGKKLGFPCRFIQDIIGIIKLFDGFCFFIISFDNHMSAVGFFHLTIDMSQILLLCAEMFL